MSDFRLDQNKDNDIKTDGPTFKLNYTEEDAVVESGARTEVTTVKVSYEICDLDTLNNTIRNLADQYEIAVSLRLKKEK